MSKERLAEEKTETIIEEPESVTKVPSFTFTKPLAEVINSSKYIREKCLPGHFSEYYELLQLLSKADEENRDDLRTFFESILRNLRELESDIFVFGLDSETFSLIETQLREFIQKLEAERCMDKDFLAACRELIEYMSERRTADNLNLQLFLDQVCNLRESFLLLALDEATFSLALASVYLTCPPCARIYAKLRDINVGFASSSSVENIDAIEPLINILVRWTVHLPTGFKYQAFQQSLKFKPVVEFDVDDSSNLVHVLNRGVELFLSGVLRDTRLDGPPNLVKFFGAIIEVEGGTLSDFAIKVQSKQSQASLSKIRWFLLAFSITSVFILFILFFSIRKRNMRKQKATAVHEEQDEEEEQVIPGLQESAIESEPEL